MRELLNSKQAVINRVWARRARSYQAAGGKNGRFSHILATHRLFIEDNGAQKIGYVGHFGSVAPNHLLQGIPIAEFYQDMQADSLKLLLGFGVPWINKLTVKRTDTGQTLELTPDDASGISFSGAGFLFGLENLNQSYQLQISIEAGEAGAGGTMTLEEISAGELGFISAEAAATLGAPQAFGAYSGVRQLGSFSLKDNGGGNTLVQVLEKTAGDVTVKCLGFETTASQVTQQGDFYVKFASFAGGAEATAIADYVANPANNGASFDVEITDAAADPNTSTYSMTVGGSDPYGYVDGQYGALDLNIHTASGATIQEITTSGTSTRLVLDSEQAGKLVQLTIGGLQVNMNHDGGGVFSYSGVSTNLSGEVGNNVAVELRIHTV